MATTIYNNQVGKYRYYRLLIELSTVSGDVFKEGCFLRRDLSDINHEYEDSRGKNIIVCPSYWADAEDVMAVEGKDLEEALLEFGVMKKPTESAKPPVELYVPVDRDKWMSDRLQSLLSALYCHAMAGKYGEKFNEMMDEVYELNEELGE